MLKNNLPVILLKGLVLLPLQEERIEVNNDITKKTINYSKDYCEDNCLIVTPLESLEEAPETNDLPKIGVVAKIVSRIDLPNGNSRIVLTGVERVKVLRYSNLLEDKNILTGTVISFPKVDYNEIEQTALLRKLTRELELYINKNPYISNSILSQIRGIDDLEKLTDIVANFLRLNIDKRTSLMTEPNKIIRAKRLITELNIELAVLNLEDRIESKLRNDLDDMQKEMILKEKIKIIKNELGEKDNKTEFITKINSIIENSDIPLNVKNRIENELNRYEVILETNPELSTIKNYIETLISIPFGKYTLDETNIKNIEESLNNRHYALEEVKTRILEYASIKINNDNAYSPIICLIGPPGVGKTTLAESIALALNKKFYKISLAGINDPSELLGHRKTYIGSEPGKIISSIIKTGVMNPVILLDEVDKMASDYKGDPVNVLLDLLDTNQSKTFTDNYIEEKIDLSKVMFILTANDRNMLPLVLQDRIEVIELNSYLDYEKKEIAKQYLVKYALNNACLNSNSIVFNDDVLLFLIEEYTSESGVRELDRLINRIIRKIILKNKLENKDIENIILRKKDIISFLGSPKKSNRKNNNNQNIGYVKGLAYTPLGGEVLEIEVSSYDGKEEIITSGHLGEVLRESISISYGYIKSNASKFGLKKDAFNQTLHINFREGAVLKEGPSAGITITNALLSYLLKKSIPSSVSSSGEITLLGDVLKVGGLREKTLAAMKNNIDKIYLSIDNKADIDELPKEIKNNISFVFVSNYIEIFNDLFKKK